MLGQTERSSSSRNPPLLQSNQNQESRCSRILNNLDIFSYVPVPHTYPVSTTKSQIGSIVFLVVIVSYLTYDFVKYITQNSPLVSSHDLNLPQDLAYTAPDIAFGFMYGQGLNMTLNDESYFQYQFNTIYNYESNTTNTAVQKKVPLNLITNCQPSWLGEYGEIYKNLTCVNSTMKLMNVASQDPNSITQRLTITACQPTNNTSCQNATSLAQMTSGGRFFLLINLPAGFDYNKGKIDQSESSVQIYQFFLVPGLYSRINIDYYPFQVITTPTYLKSWTYNNYYYMQAYEPVVHFSNVSIFNSNLMVSVTFDLFSTLTVVTAKYETIINRVSSWGALASLIMTLFGICCLAYNKGKFLQKHPTWNKFDEALKNKQIKVNQIQLQNFQAAKNENQNQRQKQQQQSQKQIQSERQNHHYYKQKQTISVDIAVQVEQTQIQQDEEEEDFGGLAAIRKRLQQGNKNKNK